jgi:hypothetical protein
MKIPDFARFTFDSRIENELFSDFPLRVVFLYYGQKCFLSSLKLFQNAFYLIKKAWNCFRFPNAINAMRPQEAFQQGAKLPTSL